MKKLILLLSFAFLLTTGIKAQILTESFDYPAGDSVQQHGWITSGTVYTNQVKVTSPGLFFPGYQLPGVGNACTLTNVGEDVYVNCSSNVNSGSVYAFFLVKVDTARPLGDYFASFLPSTSPTNFVCRVYVRKAVTLASNRISFGIIKNALGGGGLVYGDSTYTTGTTYLLCAKHTFIAGTQNDKVDLFIFSPGDVIPNFEPAPNVTGGASTSADAGDVGRFAFRQGSATIAANVVIDEIYMGTDWGTLLPVELNSFTYSAERNNIQLNWSTASELNNSGFDIERSSVSGQWTKIGYAEGKGTVNTINNYSFTDRNLSSGKYNYRLKQTDFNGNYKYYNLNGEVNIGTPSEFSLSQNYPNPFNPSTTISFGLPYDSKVSVKIYDMTGKKVSSVVNEFKSAGYYSINFNASDLSSGFYFYSINADNYTATKKMILVK